MFSQLCKTTIERMEINKDLYKRMKRISTEQQFTLHMYVNDCDNTKVELPT